MRVLVLGAGATGGYFGTRLMEAGADVSFLVRPQRAAKLARDGLKIYGAKREFHGAINAITSVSSPAEFDLILLSCKAYDLQSAIAAIAPAVGKNTRILPLLNGLRHLQALDAEFGAEHVLGGLCQISVGLDNDGAIKQVGSMDRLNFGVRSPAQTIPDVVRAGLLKVEVGVSESDDILAAMWRKFTFITALAGITSLMRATIGEIVATADGADLATWLFMECAETARRSGYPPSDASIAETIEILTAPNSPLKASMARDLERGARTEVEHVLGDMLARARTHGVDAPLLSAACTHLRIHEARLI
jgi:2-dehydropantoate 2-reductase